MTLSRGVRARTVTVALVVLAYAAFAALKLVLTQGDATSFVNAGDFFVNPARLEAPLRVLPHSYGYDGQFAYRLALDPFTNRITDHGIRLDTPALRAQRIGYPLIARLVSLGSPGRVAASLILVNLAAVALLTWAATGIALFYHRPTWHGLIVALYPGLLLSLARDTTELVSTALAVTAIGLALRHRPWAAGLIACAAVLTRETTLLYLFGFGAVTAWRAVAARRVDPAVAAFMLPVVVALAWQAALIAIWHTTSFADVGSHDLALPPLRYLLAALAKDAADLTAPGPAFLRLYSPLTKLFFLAEGAIVIACLRRVGTLDWRLVLPWVSYLLLASLFTEALWETPYGYVRVLVDLNVTGALLVLASPGARSVRLLLGLTVPLWLLTWGYA